MNLSLDDCLLPKAQWRARRTEYLQRADLLEVADGQPTWFGLTERLEQHCHHTNQRFSKGRNPRVYFHTDGSFQVTTPTAETEESDSVRSLLPGEHYISLVEVLSTVNHPSHFYAILGEMSSAIKDLYSE
jgi:hypothetical protein